MKRLLCCGDRNWTDYQMIENAISQFAPNLVIEGEARGADLLSRKAAEALGIPVLPFPADWVRYKKAAGPIRNQQQLVEGRPTHALVFHDDLFNSKGTADMVRRLDKAGVPWTLVSHPGNWARPPG